MEVEKKRISGVDGPAVVRDVAITRFNYLQLYNSNKQTRAKKKKKNQPSLRVHLKLSEIVQ